jgi:hypothetical protein
MNTMLAFAFHGRHGAGWLGVLVLTVAIIVGVFLVLKSDGKKS